MSSRFTARAKALSFIFFSTPFTSTSRIDLVGFTSAQAVRNPASSSQANSARSRCDSRRHAGVVRMRQDRVQHRLRPSLLAQRGDADERMLLLRRMPFVVHVVQQPRARIQRDKLRGLVSGQPEPRRFRTPYASVHTETARPCLRRLSPWVHSSSNSSARSRECSAHPFLRSLQLYIASIATALEPRTSDSNLFTLCGSTLGFFLFSSGIFGSTP